MVGGHRCLHFGKQGRQPCRQCGSWEQQRGLVQDQGCCIPRSMLPNEPYYRICELQMANKSIVLIQGHSFSLSYVPVRALRANTMHQLYVECHMTCDTQPDVLNYILRTISPLHEWLLMPHQRQGQAAVLLLECPGSTVHLFKTPTLSLIYGCVSKD